MTKNMYMLTTKNEHYIANRKIHPELMKRYKQIFHNETTPEDSCPFDITCDECKFFMSDGCALAFKEGG